MTIHHFLYPAILLGAVVMVFHYKGSAFHKQCHEAKISSIGTVQTGQPVTPTEIIVLEAKRKREAELQRSFGGDGVGQEATWGTHLIAAIHRHWVRPDIGNQTVRKVILNIVMDRHTGDVQSVAIRESSGDSRVDRSCLMAVIAASPLPLPNDPRIFQSSINLTFIPR